MRSMALLCVLLVLGCDDGAPEIPEFSGRWSGTYESLSLDLLVIEDDGDLSGSGTFSGQGGSFAFSIEGVHSHPDVSFTATATGFEDFNFAGEFEGGDVVEGRLNGSGFVNDALILRRD